MPARYLAYTPKGTMPPRPCLRQMRGRGCKLLQLMYCGSRVGSRLTGNVVVELGDDLLKKVDSTPLDGLEFLVVALRGHNTDECPIGPIHFDRVQDQVPFGPVFAGGEAVVRLIPVEHDLFTLALFDYVAIDDHGAIVSTRNREMPRLNRHPSSAGQAVFGGMDGIASTLAGKIGNV